jgi:hypothetical protein
MTTADDVSENISHVPYLDMYAPNSLTRPSTHFGDLILVSVAHFLYHITSSALLTGYLPCVQHDTSSF